MSVALPSLPGYQPKPPIRLIRIKQKPDDRSNDIVKNQPKQFTHPISKATDTVETRVLSFQGYFDEKYNGTERPRQCQLNYFMQTGEINVLVKSQPNSGIIPGTLVPRKLYFHSNGESFMPSDFNLDSPLLLMGITFHLTDCDFETREYLRRNTTGYDLATSSVTSTMKMSIFDEWGRFHSKRNENKTFLEAMLGNSVNNCGREGFLRYGNNVLKFRLRKHNPSIDDVVTDFALVYYLSDDTVEVFALADYNGNRNGFSKLLKRSKLPKVRESLSISCISPDSEYYHWCDFCIGTVINLYEKHLRIIDTDAYTRTVYEEIGNPLDPPELIQEQEFQFALREIPPPTGFGSEEDSLRSCTGSLEARPPAVKSFGEDKSYNFKAILKNGSPDDIDREFVISYFFTDNSVKVTEPPKRNSGFVGGVFMSRRQVKIESGDKLSDKHLYIGALVTLSRQVFLLLDADVRTLHLMEEANHPRANIGNALQKLRPLAPHSEDLRSLFQRTEGSLVGIATRDTLISTLSAFQLIGDGDDQLSDHEVLTIIRTYGTNADSNDEFYFNRLVDDISKTQLN